MLSVFPTFQEAGVEGNGLLSGSRRPFTSLKWSTCKLPWTRESQDFRDAFATHTDTHRQFISVTAACERCYTCWIQYSRKNTTNGTWARNDTDLMMTWKHLHLSWHFRRTRSFSSSFFHLIFLYYSPLCSVLRKQEYLYFKPTPPQAPNNFFWWFQFYFISQTSKQKRLLINCVLIIFIIAILSCLLWD